MAAYTPEDVVTLERWDKYDPPAKCFGVGVVVDVAPGVCQSGTMVTVCNTGGR